MGEEGRQGKSRSEGSGRPEEGVGISASDGWNVQRDLMLGEAWVQEGGRGDVRLPPHLVKAQGQSDPKVGRS